nr:hypothetical protein Q903MT_gene3373 [Picea sitchensis]
MQFLTLLGLFSALDTKLGRRLHLRTTIVSTCLVAHPFMGEGEDAQASSTNAFGYLFGEGPNK